VDIVEDPDGRQWVLEVNSGVEFTGFHHAHPETDVADIMVRYAKAALADAC
jgi:glutathione synthase/RimK-type ligase-like ATP-grasp enzyme